MSPVPGTPLILVVDDNEAGRYVCAHALRAAGFDVAEAATGEEALTVAAARRPDLVVLDVNLPDIHGFEVRARLKSAPTTANVPVVHVSAIAVSAESRVVGLQGGADAYLTAPLSDGELVATVGAVLRLAQAEKAARTAAVGWEMVWASSATGLALVDVAGRFLRANPALGRLLGVDPADLIGSEMARLMHPDDAAATMAELRSMAAAGTSLRLERRYRRADGSYLWAEVITNPVFDPDGSEPRFFVQVLDISARVRADASLLTERKRVEAELATRARQQAVVSELGLRALADLDLPSLMNEAADAVARTLDVEYANILELLPSGEFVLRAGVGWEEGLVGQATVPAGLDSQVSYTIAYGGPVVVEDLSLETRFRASPLLMGHGVMSGMSVAIRGEAEPYGLLGADTTRHRSFSPDDVNFLGAVANVVADALARAGVEAELATRARQQAVVSELGLRALADLDLPSLMNDAANAVARTLDVEYANILELLPSGEFVLRAGVGWEEGLVGQATVPAGLDSQAGYTIAYGGPVVVEDVSLETRFRASPLLMGHGVMSGMSVAIMGTGPWGVLGGHTSSRRRFRSDDAHFLQAAANILAEAIRRGEVEGALRAARDEEHRLRQRLEAHSKAAVDAQEGERRRIARELHDEIGQSLTGLKLMLEDHECRPTGARADRMGRANALVGELLRQVQDLSLDLRPAMLDDLGLRPALLWLVERYAAQTAVEVALECQGLDWRLRPDVETAAYRIVQEALTNVARHAGVSLVTVGCSLTEDSLRVEVSDEGVGFEVEALRPGQSSGLAGMEERARATGGQFRVRSELGRGTSVIAELPLAKRPTPDP